MIAAAAATRDHLGDLVVPLRREHAEDDERRLARQREPERLEHDHDEEQRQPVVGEEVRHEVRRRRYRRDEGRVPRETAPGERRVALVPETVGKLAAAGFEVVVEPGAGDAASFPDDAYTEAGATLGDRGRRTASSRCASRRRTSASGCASGQLLIGFLDPLSDRDGVEALAARGVTAFAMESIPRITRAQSMDALSSQATVGGYKAALLAAEHLPRFFPMLMTAAGTVPPAKVLVIGAGVAGLQAIATARRLGAVDDRLRRPPGRARADREPRRELARPRRHRRRGRGRLRARADARGDAGAAAGARGADRRLRRRDHDRGRAGPRGAEDHPRLRRRAMRPGSVIVDLAADTGGNCELTEPGEVVERDGVTLVGLTNLPSTMPYHASMLYSRNVQALLLHLAPGGELALDWSDEITPGACVAGSRKEPPHEPQHDCSSSR